MGKEVLVIYHNHCYDGVTAAYICWTRFRDLAEYRPFNYSDPPLTYDDVKGRDVIVVDFSFKREVLESIKREAKSLIVLDHHKTAQADLEGLPYCIFDMNRSGAGIAFDYFYPNSTRTKLVNYVEDRDLWRFASPGSREINAWIQSWEIDLEVWKKVASIMEVASWDDLFKQGTSLLRQQSKLAKEIAANSHDLDIATFRGPHVVTSVLMSEVCEQLLKDHPEALYASYHFQRKDGKYQYGLRSRASENFDVSLIAKTFGGGGHKNAAGFELDFEL